MKKNRKIIIILCVILGITAGLIDWGALKAKRTLAEAGLKELTPDLLVEKIESGETDTALLIVRSGTVNKVEPVEVKTVFQVALNAQDLDVAAAILPKCEGLSVKDHDDCLRATIEDRHFKSSAWLTENGFSKDILMDNKLSPLDWSIALSDEESTAHLIKCSFPLTSKEGKVSTLEHALVSKSSPELIGSLIKYGADQNSFSVNNEPLLHYALANSSTDVVASMLTPETNLNITNALGDPALQKAIETGDVTKVQTLTTAGVDLSYINPQGGNYLDTAIRLVDAPDIITHLLSIGIDSQHRNSEGLNALEQAFWLERPLSASALAQGGALTAQDFFSKNYAEGKQMPLATMFASGLFSPNTTLSNGDTPLIDCVVNKRYDMISFLIGQKADLELVGVDKERPLAYAIGMQDYKAAELLLTAGAEPQFTFQDTVAPRVLELIETEGVIKWFMDKDSRITPLMVACDQGNLEMCKLLKRYGAEESSTKKHRFWAGNFAARRSKTDIVQLMLGAEPGNRDRTVVVDLSSQRATVYNKEKKTVMSFRISSGKKGNATRKGEFVVTNKKVNHVSTIYDVNMPYFQRLSYSDFGFHTGYVPGYPASHGCIRCPSSYAKKLYYHLKVGDVVTIQQ